MQYKIPGRERVREYLSFYDSCICASQQRKVCRKCGLVDDLV